MTSKKGGCGMKADQHGAASPLASRLQQQAGEFAEFRGYELIDMGVFIKAGWTEKESHYGIQMGLNLLTGTMGFVLVWFNNSDCVKCSMEFEAKDLNEVRAVLDHLDTAIEQLNGAASVGGLEASHRTTEILAEAQEDGTAYTADVRAFWQ